MSVGNRVESREKRGFPADLASEVGLLTHAI